MKMKMCYRGVYYDYKPVIRNLNEQQQYFIDHSLDNTQSIQTKFLGKISCTSILNYAKRHSRSSNQSRKTKCSSNGMNKYTRVYP